MVDASLVLDAIVAVSIAAGALFAVMELRDLKRDRRTQLVLEMFNKFSESDYIEHAVKITYTDFKDGKEAEQKCSAVSLWAVGNYMDGIGMLVERNLVDRGIVFESMPFDLLWDKMRPWVLYTREKLQAEILLSFERTAGEKRRYDSMQTR